MNEQQISVDFSKATDITCPACGNATFQEVYLIKHLSALVSPTGRATFVPVNTYACNACGHIPKQFLPSTLQAAAEAAQAAPTPGATKLEIIKD